MQLFAKDRCLHTFFFRDKGGDLAAPSESLWTLYIQSVRVALDIDSYILCINLQILEKI